MGLLLGLVACSHRNTYFGLYLSLHIALKIIAVFSISIAAWNRFPKKTFQFLTNTKKPKRRSRVLITSFRYAVPSCPRFTLFPYRHGPSRRPVIFNGSGAEPFFEWVPRKYGGPPREAAPTDMMCVIRWELGRIKVRVKSPLPRLPAGVPGVLHIGARRPLCGRF